MFELYNAPTLQRRSVPLPPAPALAPAAAGRELPAQPPPPGIHPLLRGHDPQLIRRIHPWISWLAERYYRAEVEGIEHLSDRGCLTVSTHNGSLFTPDIYCLLAAFWRRFGLETPGHALTHDAALKIPLLGPLFAGLGALPASPRTADLVLDHDRPLLICPGGDVDCLKPFSRRHVIDFGGRHGFIRLALRRQVPIIPVVSVGAHEVLFVLNDGRRAAERFGFARWLRIKSVPLALGFPTGLTIAGVGAIPLPSKIRLRVLPPVELAEPPRAARDGAVVARCAAHVRALMQRALDRLAAQRRHVVLG